MQSSESTVTIPALQQMKRDRQKIVGVVAWDVQIALIVDRAGSAIRRSAPCLSSRESRMAW